MEADGHGKVRPSDADADADADERLASLGYTAELARNRSTLQVAFMSFVLASIPYGLATTMYYPLVGGGPVNVVWGWLAVSVVAACMAASLGEITSVYPTAGGVYYQASMLAPAAWRRPAAWVCGWLYLVGNVTITLAVNFGTAQFVVGCVNVFDTPSGAPVMSGDAYQVVLIFVAITLLCNATSALGNRWLPILDTFAIFWTFAGLLAMMISVLALARDGRRDARFVFTRFDVSSGWTAGWSFCIGLLQAAYATSSTGMIISMCEEVRSPATQVPKAMVATVLLNTLAGLLFLLPLLFVLPDVAEVVARGQPVPYMLKSAVGHAGGAFALAVPLMVLAVLCGVGCTTAASRCVWAFSRDGAVPGSHLWRRVDRRLDVPLRAMMLSMAVQMLLALIYFGSSTAFAAFSAVGVIALTLSYVAPIVVSLMDRRAVVSTGRFYLGSLGLVCNVVVVAWSVLVIPLFCMPTTLPVTVATMNYASVVFVGFTAVSAAWYVVWGRKHYHGPPTRADGERSRG